MNIKQKPLLQLLIYFFIVSISQWSQRNALFEPISEATPTVLPTTVQRSAAEWVGGLKVI